MARRGTKLHNTWMNLRQRCRNPNHPAYKNYGGRGISYDPRWDDFHVFCADVGSPPTKDHTLDRVDNSGGYFADNVRWASRSVQSRNTRQNIFVEIDGVLKCLYDWCDDYGIAAASVYRRLHKGEDVVSAITRPKAPRFRLP